MKLVARALILVVAAAGLGLVVNAVRPGGLRFGSFEAPATCDAAEAAGTPLELSPADAAKLCGQPDVLIADARPANRFAEGHVAGAIHLPCDARGAVAADGSASPGRQAHHRGVRRDLGRRPAGGGQPAPPHARAERTHLGAARRFSRVVAGRPGLRVRSLQRMRQPGGEPPSEERRPY